MSRRVWSLVLLSIAGAAQPQVGSAQRFDVVLRNGTVLDGSGLPPYRADVAMANGRIARIGKLPRDSAALDLDVTGLYLAPGFINIHSHLQPAALPRAENMLTQGVTTEITNADGAGPIDLRTPTARVAKSGLSVNVGAYIGFTVSGLQWSASPSVGQPSRRSSGCAPSSSTR